MCRKYAQMYPSVYSMVRCNIYQLSFLKHLYEQGIVDIVFSTYPPFVRNAYLVMIVLVIITGVLGELIFSFFTGRNSND